jgi:hypothetical protein
VANPERISAPLTSGVALVEPAADPTTGEANELVARFVGKWLGGRCAASHLRRVDPEEPDPFRAASQRVAVMNGGSGAGDDGGGKGCEHDVLVAVPPGERRPTFRCTRGSGGDRAP